MKMNELTHEIRVHGREGSPTHALCVNSGVNLRVALLGALVSPYSGVNRRLNCKGLGVCGTCKVLVRENGEWWSRRSCQIQCFQDLEIQLE